MLLVLLPSLVAGQIPALSLPLRCTPGEDCWIANHVDLDPGPGARDYACGEFTYDGHNGIDIALRDLKAMAEGVPVLAAAPGRVLRARDSMPDASVRETGAGAVKDRECGNGVLVEHAGGLQTQYCHLRRGSVRVRSGKAVMAGDALGLVGLSGRTEYPHLHFTVRRGGAVVDPFRGLEDSSACGPGPAPLWAPAALASLPYAPRAIYNFGVAPEAITAEAARRGGHRAREIPATAAAYALWMEAFAVGAGDIVEMRVATPDGTVFFQERTTLEKRQARIFRIVAKKRGAAPWPAGTYANRISIVPKDGMTASVEFEAEVR